MSDLDRYQAPKKPSIKEQLKENFPDYFQQEEKFSPFRSVRTKKESSTEKNIKKNAEFIKTYHDLVAKKYEDIQFRKTTTLEEQYRKRITLEVQKLNIGKATDRDYEKVLETLDEKEMEFFKELKELDEKVKKLLEEQPRKLNEELYELSPDNYPQTTIIGRNALQSRKKSILIDDTESSTTFSGEEEKSIDDTESSTTFSGEEEKSIDGTESLIALTGVEYIKFLALSNLIEVENKIVESKEYNKEDSTKKNYAIKSVENIHRDLQFSPQDIKFFLDLYKRFQYSPNSPNKNPIFLLKNIFEASQKKAGTNSGLHSHKDEEITKTGDAPENKNPHNTFLDLINQELELEKTSILKGLLEDYENYKNKKRDEYNGSESIETLEQKYRNKLKEFKINFPSEEDISEVISLSAPKLQKSETHLRIEFYTICLADKNAEIKNIGQDGEKAILIQERDEIKEKISDLKYKGLYKVFRELLINYHAYILEDNERDKKIEFEKKYRKNLAEFLEACPTEKERLEAFQLFAGPLDMTEKELKTSFYYACLNDTKAELMGLKDRDKKPQELMLEKIIEKMIKSTEKMIEEYYKKIDDPDLQEPPQEPPQETSQPPHKNHNNRNHNPSNSSLFWGLIDLEFLRNLAKEIDSSASKIEKFNKKLNEETKKPSPDIIKAFKEAFQEAFASPPDKSQ